MRMKYREQLQHEIDQAESQLKKLEKSERSKMRERNNLNQEILKILLKKQGIEKELKKKKEILRYLSSMTMILNNQKRRDRKE
nr:MAG TPA: hypothetical protein [Caudoviricetes sp.]